MATTKHPTIGEVSVGEDVLISVVSAANRTTYFPEQAAVFGRAPDSVEIILLRQEVALRSQIGKVTADEGEFLQMEFRPNAVETEMVDIAHLRMGFGAATDMALAIASLAINTGVIDLDSIVNRLQSASVQST